jgi:low affinity Fe/Cu permease
MHGKDVFQRFAAAASIYMGSPHAFVLAITTIVGWAATGPVFGFNEEWQLYANTFTTLATYIMVFILQSSQNRDARAIHLKLDELIAVSKARNKFADLEHATEKELNVLQDEFAKLRKDGTEKV